jgi:hypothetical protein
VTPMRYWLMDGSSIESKLVWVGKYPSECKRQWLRIGKPGGYRILEMPANDPLGLTHEVRQINSGNEGWMGY